MAQTCLRIVTYDIGEGSGTPTKYLEDSLQEVIPMLHGKPGFRGGHWGHDEDETVLAAVTNWASREAIESANDFLTELHAQRLARGLQVSRAVNLELVTAPTEWDAADWSAITSREASNWLRVFFYTAEKSSNERIAGYLQNSTHQTLKLLKKQPGFRVGYWGRDRVEGTMAAITYWDSKGAIEAASPELERLHQARKEHGVASSGVVNLKLIRTEVRPGTHAKGWLPLPEAHAPSRG